MEVDRPDPVFTWRLTADEADVTGAGYRIVVRLDGHAGEVVWDSGERAGDEVAVRYAGRPLTSRTAYTWHLELTGTDGSECVVSTGFETGLLHGDRCSGVWIGRHPRPWFNADGTARDGRPPSAMPRSWRTVYSAAPLQLRRGFMVDESVARARLLISARGLYRAYMNGQRVGWDELTPGWTAYESRIEYQRHDVTALLTEGWNVLAVEVADGWWSGYLGYDTRAQAMLYGSAPGLVAELRMEYVSGRTETVSTDDSWRELPGELVMSDLLMGEYRDFNLATTDWTLPHFDDAEWREACILDRDVSMLAGQAATPVRVVQQIPAVTVHQTGNGALVDFGENVVGHVRLRLSGLPADSLVTVRHGEALASGALYVDNLRTAEATDRYLLKDATDRVVLEPRFTFHGFRYAEITGLTVPLKVSDVTAVVVSSDLEGVGEFRTSSALVNQLAANIRRSQVGNFLGLPTDCPQRDERLGWTADIQVFARTASYNQDVSAFLRGWLRDLQNSQRPDGGVPDVAPLPPRSQGFSQGAPGWGDAIVLVPWILYELYGDLEDLRTDFPFMQSWVDYIATANAGGLWTQELGNNYGDWLSVDADTSKALVAAAYQIRAIDVVAAAATALGRFALADRYAKAAAGLRKQFVDRFLDDDGALNAPTQSGYLFALAWRLVPDRTRPKLVDGLVQDLEQRGRRLTTGFLGVGLLGPVLTDVGRSDLAYALLLQEDFPSWGYSIRHGATSIWERWDGWTASAGFQSIGMNSFNHYSLGSIGEWLYRSVAGIDRSGPTGGWRSLRIAPQITDALEWVEAGFESPRGRIAVSWRRQQEETTVVVEVPPGSTAQVVLPGYEEVVGSGRHEFLVPRDVVLAGPFAVPAGGSGRPE